jgi:hypothetical protein
MGIHGGLVLSGVTDETLAFRERDIGWGCSITLIIGDDLNTIILPYTNTTMKIVNIPREGVGKGLLTSMWCQDRFQ